MKENEIATKSLAGVALENINGGLTEPDSYAEWLQAMYDARNPATVCGLLHLIQGKPGHRDGSIIVPEWSCQNPELILFLLDIADGYLSLKNFKQGNHRIANLPSPSECRWFIAKKAMSVLCTVFFYNRLDGSGGRDYGWLWMLGHDRLFPAVLRFFTRVDGEKDCAKNVRSDGSAHTTSEKIQDEVIRSFLSRLCSLGWTYDKFCRDNYLDKISATRDMMVSVRPIFIWIMAAINDLSNLYGLDLDQGSRKALRELAYLDGVNLPINYDTSDRYFNPEDLVESVVKRSVAAQILLTQAAKRRQATV